MPSEKTKISVVTPLYHSADYIAEFHRRVVSSVEAIEGARYEIVFVYDGGPQGDLDAARQIAAEDPCVLVVELARNVGQHPATMAGLAYATGDLVCIMDSDLEERPEWIIPFFEAMNAQDVDVVYGISEEKRKGLFYRSMRGLFYQLLNMLAPVKFPRNVCTARMMTRHYVEALLLYEERELFMAGIWHVVGFRQMPILVKKDDRSPTTYSLVKLAGLFTNAVTAFSTRPLMIISVTGITLSLIAFLYIAYIAIRKVFVGVDVEGWASVMAAVLLIGGVTLFFNGVMAIYIAKIFIEVKQRPRSIVRSLHGARANAND